MKADLHILEQADEILIRKMLGRRKSLPYLKALEKMCLDCGWTLEEYWNTCLEKIDAGWEKITKENSSGKRLSLLN